MIMSFHTQDTAEGKKVEKYHVFQKFTKRKKTKFCEYKIRLSCSYSTEFPRDLLACFSLSIRIYIISLLKITNITTRIIIYALNILKPQIIHEPKSRKITRDQ